MADPTPRRVAAVTGGGTGVGAAVVLRLAAAGYDVAVFYRSSKDAAERTAAEATAAGARVLMVRVDVAEDESVKAGFAAVLERFGRLDVLVNSAAVTQLIPFTDLAAATDDVWNSIMNVNVVGAFRAARAAAPALALSPGGGCIVNISSIAARNAQGSCLPYSCSKAALDALTAGLARALAPSGTRVVGVAPGFIEGTWLCGLLGDGYEASRAAFAAATPLGRVCTPDDVAAAVTSLILGSAMVTGVTLTVDGGMLLGGSTRALHDRTAQHSAAPAASTGAGAGTPPPSP